MRHALETIVKKVQIQHNSTLSIGAGQTAPKATSSLVSEAWSCHSGQSVHRCRQFLLTCARAVRGSVRKRFLGSSRIPPSAPASGVASLRATACAPPPFFTTSPLALDSRNSTGANHRGEEHTELGILSACYHKPELLSSCKVNRAWRIPTPTGWTAARCPCPGLRFAFSPASNAHAFNRPSHRRRGWLFSHYKSFGYGYFIIIGRRIYGGPAWLVVCKHRLRLRMSRSTRPLQAPQCSAVVQF